MTEKPWLALKVTCTCGATLEVESYTAGNGLLIWQAWQKIHYRCTLNDQQWRRPIDSQVVLQIKDGDL